MVLRKLISITNVLKKLEFVNVCKSYIEDKTHPFN
jgi:hypothetical protein